MRLGPAFVLFVAAAAAIPAGPAPAQDRICPDWTFEPDGGPEGGVPTVYGCAGRGDAMAEIEITCTGVRYLPSVFPMEAGEPGAMPLVAIAVAEGGPTVTLPFRSEQIDGMLANEESLPAVRDALARGADVLMRLDDTPAEYADRFIARGFAPQAETLGRAC